MTDEPQALDWPNNGPPWLQVVSGGFFAVLLAVSIVQVVARVRNPATRKRQLLGILVAVIVVILAAVVAFTVIELGDTRRSSTASQPSTSQPPSTAKYPPK